MMGNNQFYRMARVIDHALNKNVVSKQVLQLIKEPMYEYYFFSVARSVKWFKKLKEKGYFSAEKAPPPRKSKEEGYVTFPQWNVLPYLEQVSKQLTKPGNQKYIEEILEIMREVTQYHLNNQKRLDNYRTWWYFVKIMLNIPSMSIPMDIIDLIPAWLDSKFDNSLPGSEIARKLLPKFLDSKESEDHRKAEKIVEAITAIRCKEMPEHRRKGLLGTEREAKTLVDSYWLEESFKANGKKVGERCSENVILSLADRLKQAFRCEDSHHQFEFTRGEKEYILRVTHERDFEFYCELHLVLYEKERDRTPEEKLLSGIEVATEAIHTFSIPNCRSKTAFVRGVAGRIRAMSGFERLVSDFKQRLAYLYEGILSDYSYIWFPLIGSGPELSVHGAKETLAILLRDVLLAKANADPGRTRKVLRAFQSAHYHYPLFKRIVIFTITQRWDTFADEFETLLRKRNSHELLDNPNYEYELSDLLSTHLAKLKTRQKEKIRGLVDAGPTRWLPDQNQQLYVARWKQKWYSVLKSDPLFGQLHKKQVKVTGVKEELPTKPVQFQSRVGPGRSPLTKDELLAKPNEELVTFLASFRTKDRWKGPSVGGLAEALSAAAESEPSKFVVDIMPFINTGYTYVYYLLFGLRSAWSQKKPFDWEKLLQFLWTYTDKDHFWNDQLMVQDDELKANHRWVTGMIGGVVQEGTRDDAWAFSEGLLPQAKRLLFLVLDREKPEEHRGGDFLTDALNSVHGKMISALLLLALRVARIEDKKGLSRDERWAPDIKARYDALLAKGVVEAYTFLGNYMPNLYYLDAQWMKERIQSMSQESNETLWAAFMEGYLLGPRFYTDLYQLMKPNYDRALRHFSGEDHVNRRLVEHIAWRYLDGAENLADENGLFRKLLDRWDVSQMENAIQFFWGQRDHLAKTPSHMLIKKLPPELQKRRQRIIQFWRWTYDKNFKSSDLADFSDGDSRILGSLSKLTVFLREIDSEKAEWLMASVPSARMDVGFDAPFFLEYLNDLKDADSETTKYVGKILRKLAETSAPDFKQEHIHSIVEYLYASGDKDNIQNANDTCNLYGSKGLHFLRDLWEKNNP